MDQKNNSQSRQTVLLLAILLVISAVLGYGTRTRLPGWFGQGAPPVTMTPKPATPAMDWTKLEDIKSHVINMYNGPIVENTLLEGALKGMVNSLQGGGQYFNAREFAEIQARPSLIRGTGIHLGVEDGRLIVLRVDEDSQAEKAGIYPGDILLKINERVYTGNEIEAARNLMLHNDRRTVSLQLLREDHQYNVLVGLRLLTPQKVRSLVKDGIGILRIPEFNERVEQELDKRFEEMTRAGAQAFVLDLRDLPAGKITEAVRLAGKFIPQGQAIVTIRDTRGSTRQFTSDSGLLAGKPVVVLINSRSEGTAEFVAGALKKQANALLVGEATPGEGRVYSYINLPQGEGIKLVTGYYILPDGQEIQDRGIRPDLNIPGSPLHTNNLIQPMDLQMARALEEAGNRMITP